MNAEATEPARKFSATVSARTCSSLSYRISELYRNAERDGLSHKEIIERYTNLVYNDSNYKRLRECDKTYLYGFKSGLTRALESRLVWLHSVDGKLLTKEQTHFLALKEDGQKKSKARNYRGPYFRIDSEKSGFFYVDECGMPRFDKKWA